LRNLREHLPEAEIVLLARAFAPELLATGAPVDRVLVLEDGRLRSTQLQTLAAEAFDLAIDLHYDYPIETARLVRAAQAACSAGFDIGGRGALFDVPVPAHERKHFVEETFDVLRALGLSARPAAPEVHLSAEAYALARQALAGRGVGTRYAVFHPGGHYPEQRWPASRFVDLAHRVADLGLAPVFLGGDEDAALLREIGGGLAVRAGVVCGERIGVSAAVIAGSALFVGNNSGPLHIACALGVPTVSTMGPTDPVRFWPVSTLGVVVRAPSVTAISLPEMLAAVRQTLSRRPAAAG
jgi:ADP-heptose:LPS heptosyltransferase